MILCRSVSRGLCNRKHRKYILVVFMFIGAHHSNYHKQGREANNFGKDFTSLLTLRRRLCGGFIYYELG